MPRHSSLDYVLDSRGYFWPAGAQVPEGKSWPSATLSGRLRIQVDGVSELVLDGILQTPDFYRRMIVLGTPCVPIAGILTDGGRKVLLSEVVGSGGQSGGGPSMERLLARRCLVASTRDVDVDSDEFQSLVLPLDGFEDWVGDGTISVEKGDQLVKASYPEVSPAIWQLKEMTVELSRFLRGSGGDRLTTLAWQERAELRIEFGESGLTSDRAIKLVDRIEDLLILLTDCDRALDFPWLRREAEGPRMRLYFARSSRSAEEKVDWHRAWLRFGACTAEFGGILEKWLDDHETHGPGFHLYLGNRRGQKMYLEHRFASLMWGLEALHRSLVPAKEQPAQAIKVERILGQINAKKDRDWAERFLPKGSEVTLAARISELVSMLPLNVSAKTPPHFHRR